jgi:hypothetical protein
MFIGLLYDIVVIDTLAVLSSHPDLLRYCCNAALSGIMVVCLVPNEHHPCNPYVT